jgi:ferrous-iron efflux pump FieF
MAAHIPSRPGASHTQGVMHRQTQAAKLSLYSNIALVIIKVVAGLMSGAISVLAEGVQSGLDVLASLMILWTVQRAATPPDRSHPYGHGKLESLASLIQVGLIGGSAFYIIHVAWERWNAPEMPRLDWGVAALSIAIVVNYFVSRHLKTVADETGSHAIAAESVHLKSDLLSCAGVLLGLAAVWVTKEPRLDPLIAAFMAVVVIVSSLKLARETVRPLLDEKLPGEEEAQIRAVLNADPRVLDYHRLRTRQAGSHRLMDVHIQLDDHLSFKESHDITEEVEDAIRAVLPNLDIIVHAEPYEEELRHQQEAHHTNPARQVDSRQNTGNREATGH